MASDKPRMVMHIDEKLLEAIDDFRFKHRFPSRAATVTWLLAWALKQKPVPPKRKKEEDY